MKYKSKRCCIKIINGNQYLYSWKYRGKHLRTSRKNQRYEWKYRGAISSIKTQNYISLLPLEVQEQLKVEVGLKQEEIKKEQDAIFKLKNTEPYFSKHQAIMNIANRYKRKGLMKELEKELKLQFTLQMKSEDEKI